jgi:hypothetical protein
MPSETGAIFEISVNTETNHPVGYVTPLDCIVTEVGINIALSAFTLQLTLLTSLNLSLEDKSA